MKIITWNIKHGGGSRITSIVNTIKNYTDIDCWVISEFRNNKQGLELIENFKKIGFVNTYTYIIEENKNTVLVASKNAYKKCEVHIENHSHRVLKLENDIHILYACYFPQKNEKAFVFDYLISETQTILKNCIITGDINTGKHYIDEEKATFYCANKIVELEKNGTIDAFRYFQPTSKEFSWYSNSGNGFRIDHFWLMNFHENEIKDCSYIHEPRVDKISDHSMMILEIIE